ncbi:MAG TPA: hypothetical protein VHS09_06745 [Polyangiaceae bacterium]|nr:hypothetical protein [Polyangiaceae bacterium]
MALPACGGSERVLPEGGAPADASIHDAGAAQESGIESGCVSPPWELGADAEPAWATGSCPDSGCPSATVCVRVGIADAVLPLGCAPVPESCGGNPTCGCMGCVCGGGAPPFGGCGSGNADDPVGCNTGTVSRRAFKDDVTYVNDEEREALARQALEVRLARYRYKGESPDARRRLGFLIDDQPDPSPAVDTDRTHVDEYGYASMLLATVQEQSKELEALRRRLEALEHGEAPPGARLPRAPRGKTRADRKEAPDAAVVPF